MATRTIKCPACGTFNRVPLASTGKARCGQCQSDLPWLVEVDGATLDSVVKKSTVPVLVDLWAPWCAPCRAVAPALEKLSRDRAGALRIAKVNVDKAPKVSVRLQVQGIPTMVLYHRGKEISRQVGALPGDRIGRWIDDALAPRRQ